MPHVGCREVAVVKEALVAQHCGAKDGVLTAMPDEAVDWLTALISV